MRVLMCGDRNWTDEKSIREVLSNLVAFHSEVIVIEGEAPGADSISRDVAESMGIQVLKFPALWKTFGRAAGPVRNKQMLMEGKPDMVCAFHNNLRDSKGTKNMVRQAINAGVPVYLKTLDEPLMRVNHGI